MEEIFINIHETNVYSLFCQGVFIGFSKDNKDVIIMDGRYKIILFYTYAFHRRAYIVRFPLKGEKGINLPGFTHPMVSVLKVTASKIDKLKKSISFTNKRVQTLSGVYGFSDLFFYKLEILLSCRGPVDNSEVFKLLLKEETND